jgi:serine/threonine protein kinase
MNKIASPGDWVGSLIDQRFPLFEWLGSTESGELFRTELPGPRTQKAAIRLVPADVEGAQAQFDDWAQAEGLSHPHLLRIFESGRGRIVENEFLYVVMELPEEALAHILPTRALTAAEAGDMLPPVLDALAYLHSRGLVHGHLNPANILAVDDRLKLSADKLQQTGRLRKLAGGPRTYDPPEIAQGNLSPASDVWSLGVTLVEALTQLPPIWNTDHGGDPIVPQFVPEPFAAIARKCLRIDPAKRATLAELEAVLRAPAVRAPSIPSPPPHPPAPAPTPTAAATAIERTPTAPKPKPPEPVPATPAQASLAFDEPKPSRRNLWSHEGEEDGPTTRTTTSATPAAQSGTRPSTPLIVGAVALLVVIIGAVWLRSHKAQPQPAQDVQTTSAPGTTPAPQAAAPQAASAKGTVADRVMPDVLAEADKTIHGRVLVKVRLWVDSNGAVYRSALDFDGRSHYFANLALEAAKKWHFGPARAHGQPMPSIWVLKFEFRRGKTDVTPVEVTP